MRHAMKVEALPAAIARDYDGFIFDMDGVLWQGARTVPGAPEAIAWLTSQGKKVFFATNNSTLTREQYQNKLVKYGFSRVDLAVIYCSAHVAARYLERRSFTGKIYVIGKDSLKAELGSLRGVEIFDSSSHEVFKTQEELNELDVDTSIGAVVVGFDPAMNYFKLAYASLVLRHNPDALFIATNADRNFPAGKWALPGTGCWVAAVEAASGRQALIVAKPAPYIVDDILEQHPNLEREKLCMVGDNLLTDIAFGRKNGLGTMLVETGIHRQSDVDRTDKSERPDHVVPSVADLRAAP
eukprot:Polyplicarium_translucidae@DN3369_c0_g1_i12.p1